MSISLSLSRKRICENKDSGDIFDGMYLERVSPIYQLLFLVRMITAVACISAVAAKGDFLP